MNREGALIMRLPYYSFGFLLSFSLLINSHGLAADATKLKPQVPPIENDTTLTPEVAREIAEIQRELGGSIVSSPRIFTAPQPVHPSMPTLKYPSRLPGWETGQPHFQLPPSPIAVKSISEQKIEILRAAAAQLDVIASRLESIDQYLKADDLRETAQVFRVEAREQRVPTSPSPGPPAPLP
jgi:hypothetical protein